MCCGEQVNKPKTVREQRVCLHCRLAPHDKRAAHIRGLQIETALKRI